MISLIILVILTAGCASARSSTENTVEPSPTQVEGIAENTTESSPTQAESIPTEVPEITQPAAASETAVEEPTLEDVKPSPSHEIDVSESELYTFEELGIFLEVPQELYVKKEPVVNYDDPGSLDSYLFYIQNYGYPGGPSSGDFQMYGHLQYNLPPITWEEFSESVVNSPMNAYADYIEVGGLRGYDTQLAGERNRYVYNFYLDGSVLSIAVAEPTPENKALADYIVQSLQFSPGELTDESNMTLVNDPGQLYQILLPDDWEYFFQPVLGVQLSNLEANSLDFELLVEDVEGPHSNIYYKNGITLQLQVYDDSGAALVPQWPDQQQYEIYFNGIPGTVYVYVEPSTVEGEIRSLIVQHEGKSYLLRFGYADGADRDTIDRIISSFNITPESFYSSP